MTICLLVAEDHELVRAGLSATFEETEIEVVGEATTGADAVRLAATDGLDVMLLDIRLPSSDGFDVLRQVRAANKDLAVLIYSQYERLDFQDRARQLGASGYLSKRAQAGELIDAVRKVNQGEKLWHADHCESPFEYQGD